MNKKNLYNIIGILTSFIYLLIITISIFSVDKFEFFSTLIKAGLILFIPAIYSLFSGIGLIIELLTQLNSKLDNPQIFSEELESEENLQTNEEILEETKNETDEIVNEQPESNELETEKEDLDENETNNALEENHDNEPIIKNGKIQCRYCGKFNNIKRTYCYLCAKKLKD